jgi:hypothetical protein
MHLLKESSEAERNRDRLHGSLFEIIIYVVLRFQVFKY